MTFRALLPIVLRYVALVSVLALLAVVLQKYVNVALPDTPLVVGIAVVVLVLALYSNSVAWRKFLERQKAKTAALLGGSPDQLRAVLDEVERLLPRDPLAAQRALEIYSRPLREHSQLKREHLWRRARLDRSAAHELERDLREDLTAYHYALERVRGMRPQGPGTSALANELEAQIGTAEQDLTRLRQFSIQVGGNADGAA
jgi:hypothetical protein